MYFQFTLSDPRTAETLPLIDGEFDVFEINSDLEMQLRDAETANFYHDAFDSEE